MRIVNRGFPEDRVNAQDLLEFAAQALGDPLHTLTLSGNVVGRRDKQSNVSHEQPPS